MTRSSRLYTCLFSAKRYGVIAWVLCTKGLHPMIRVGVVAFTQLFFGGYMAVVRPFEVVKESVIELINESVYF